MFNAITANNTNQVLNSHEQHFLNNSDKYELIYKQLFQKYILTPKKKKTKNSGYFCKS